MALESDLHIVLKRAVERHLARGCHCWFESHVGPWGGAGSLRADVHFYRCCRSHYVECETRPSMERLLKKGSRRREIPYGDVYSLVVPDEEYLKRDWSPLRGLFDKVYAYSVEEDRLTCSLDLRSLGALRDAVLDTVMPIIRSERGRAANWWLIKRRNLLHHCLECLQGYTYPWDRCWDHPCIPYRILHRDPHDHWKYP